VPSILIMILSFIESIAVAQKFADKHDYSIDASQELLALGSATSSVYERDECEAALFGRVAYEGRVLRELRCHCAMTFCR
jgi:hypothetical protein